MSCSCNIALWSVARFSLPFQLYVRDNRCPRLPYNHVVSHSRSIIVVNIVSAAACVAHIYLPFCNCIVKSVYLFSLYSPSSTFEPDYISHLLPLLPFSHLSFPGSLALSFPPSNLSLPRSPDVCPYMVTRYLSAHKYNGSYFYRFGICVFPLMRRSSHVR